MVSTYLKRGEHTYRNIERDRIKKVFTNVFRRLNWQKMVYFRDYLAAILKVTYLLSNHFKGFKEKQALAFFYISGSTDMALHLGFL